MSRPRLLILSASTGNGHITAAAALEIAAREAGLVVENLDVLDLCPPAFQAWFRGGYETLVRKNPALWGYLYRTSDRPLFNYTFQTLLDDRFCGKLAIPIAQLKPDWVVCAHSLPQPRLVPLRRRYGFRTAIVVTDLYPHRMWLRGRPDRYFVATDWSLQALRKRSRALGERAEVTGIPIHAAFQQEVPQSVPPTVLVSAGGIGGGPVLDVADQLLGLDVDAEVVFLAGRNRALFDELTQRIHRHSGSIRAIALPQIDQLEMARRLSSAAMLVGKPGGLTTFEALATGTPFVVLEPLLIPGQEEQNAAFLEEIGAGVRVKSVSDVGSVVQDLLGDPTRREKMRVQGKSHGRPDAAATIIHRLCESPVA